MTQFRLAGMTAFAALIVGQTAFAEVTPEDLWQKWKDRTSAIGQTVTSTSENRDGDTLTITGATFASTAEGGSGSVTIPEIFLRDAGAGTVEVTFADVYQLEINGEDPDGVKTGVVLDIASADMVLIASGTVEETAYTVNAPEMKVSLVSVDGVPAADKGTDVSFDLKGIAGNYSSTGTDLQTYASDVVIDSMAILANVAEPDTPNTFNLTAIMSGLTSTNTTSIPAGVDMTNTSAALAAGFKVLGGLTFGQTEFTFDFTEADDSGTGTGTMTGGDFNFALDDKKLDYTTSTKGFSVGVSGASIPLPEVRFGFGETSVGFSMPTSKTDAPADFGFVMKLIDLTLSDDIWGLVDPAANLPRDPVTVVLDTSGTATITTDFMDPAAMEAMGDAPPGELNSLDLKDLTLRALGAEITGTGAVTFDNTDLTSFDGMPAPTGTITFNASGINALLDKLTAMGLIPEDQIAMGRMMMGMFAKPGEGEDTLTSVLEFKDGGFFANGMQLQ